MKLQELTLSAYGPFTQKKVEFSSESTLHLIYGPNEAGKSSALRAITDALFGIPLRSTDNFVHPHNKMRIGMKLLSSQEKKLSAVRRKGQKQTLRCGNDTQALRDDVLHDFIGEMDRDTFVTMFGIDHARLRQGGAEIASGKGKIGELLFTAGTGIVHMRRFRDQLQTDLESLYKPHARGNSALNLKLKQYVQLKQELKESLFSAESWRKLEARVVELEQQKQQIDSEILEKQAVQKRWQRIHDVMETVLVWQHDQQKLTEYEHVPLLPEEFSEQVQSLLSEKQQAEHVLKQAEASLTEIEAALKSLSYNQKFIQEQAKIAALSHDWAIYQKARAERPALVVASELAEQAAKEILKQLGKAVSLSEAEELRIPNSNVVQIQNLGNQYEGLLEKREARQREHQRCEQRILQLNARFQSENPPASVERLKRCVQQFQTQGNVEQQLRKLKNDQKELSEQASVALSQLSLWEGTLEELELIPLPLLPVIEKFDQRFREIDGKLETEQRRIEDEELSRTKFQRQLERLEQVNHVFTEHELGEIRALRQQAWNLVLQSWKGSSPSEQELAELAAKSGHSDLAQALEYYIFEADRVSDLLRRDADRVALKNQLQGSLATQEQKLETLRQDFSRLEASREELQLEWSELWKPAKVPPQSPQVMILWVRQQERLVEFSERLRGQARELEESESQLHEMCRVLQAELKLVGVELSGELTFSQLLNEAETVLSSIQQTVALRRELEQQLEKTQEEIFDCQTNLQEVERELLNWQDAWGVEMERLGLGRSAYPVQANQVLNDLGQLFHKLQELNEKRLRIAAIDQESELFRAAVEKLADLVEIARENETPENLYHQLTQQLQLVLAQREQCRVYEEQQTSWHEKQQEAQIQLEKTEAALTEFGKLAGSQETGMLLSIYQQSVVRKQLQQRIEEHESRILAKKSEQSFQEFVGEVLDSVKLVDQLPGLLRQQEDEIEQLRVSRDQLLVGLTEARREFRQVDGGDQAAQKSLECESLAAGMEEDCQRFFALKAAAALLSQAMERHREKSQGPVLSRASDYFARLTCGSFCGLKADFDEQGEPVLTGVRSETLEGIRPEGMSDGSCDQLYLALRLASLETWLDEHEPIPFVVDDILLNFDDERALAAMQLLHEFSRKTQVLFFTHHSHLIDLVKQKMELDPLQVIELAGC